MDYHAVAYVDGGCSHGFGITFPLATEKAFSCKADSDEIALKQCLDWIINQCTSVIINPDKGCTEVTLKSLKKNNHPLNIPETLSSLLNSMLASGDNNIH